MRIAIIGWGSLIWCPGSLGIKTRWRRDGPKLPIEFARISQDGRLTLVIHPGAGSQRTYWALSAFHRLREARDNLRRRECANVKHVHYLTKDDRRADGVPEPVIPKITEWLAAQPGLHAAVWTGLSTNWMEKRCQGFSPQRAVEYLKELEAAKEETPAKYD